MKVSGKIIYDEGLVWIADFEFNIDETVTSPSNGMGDSWYSIKKD